MADPVYAGTQRIIDMEEASTTSSEMNFMVDSQTDGSQRLPIGTLLNSVAEPYSTSKTYAEGEYTLYNGSLYKCISAITTAESWTAAHWQKVTAGNEISDLKADINNVLTNQMKVALLNCFNHVAWSDEHGQDYYDALYDALYGSDSRIVYEIPYGTDISDWSVDTEQHAFTLDEDFTFLAKMSWLPSETGAFLLDSQSTAGAVVGARIQSGMADNNANVYFMNQFNGGISNSGAGTRTSNTFPANVSHNVIFVMKNDDKEITIKTYVDGQLEYSDNRTLTDKETAYPATYYIGKNHSDNIRLWLGAVDLYRIYNEALTDTEIATILGLTQ